MPAVCGAESVVDCWNELYCSGNPVRVDQLHSHRTLIITARHGRQPHPSVGSLHLCDRVRAGLHGEARVQKGPGVDHLRSRIILMMPDGCLHLWGRAAEAASPGSAPEKGARTGCGDKGCVGNVLQNDGLVAFTTLDGPWQLNIWAIGGSTG